MIKLLITIILSWSIIVTLHELAHLLVALIQKRTISSFHLGEKLFAIKIKRFYWSPFIITGHICVMDNRKYSKQEQLFFYFAGIWSQLISTSIFLLFFYDDFFYLTLTMGFNLVSFIGQLFPLGNSDLNNFLKSIKDY